MTEFNRIFNECFLFVTMKVSSCKSDWYDKELKQLHEKKNLLYKKYLDKKTLEAKCNCNVSRNYNYNVSRYFHLIEKKKQIYYKQFLNKHKCNTKSTLKILSTILGKSNGNSRIALLINGENVVDEQEVANCFNKHFATVAQKLVDKLPKPTTHFSDYLQRSNTESLYLYATSPLKIKRITMETKSKSSSGLDDIPSKLLKLLNEDVLFALSHIINLSLKQGKFIDCFKVAKIVSVYKRRRRTIYLLLKTRTDYVHNNIESELFILSNRQLRRDHWSSSQAATINQDTHVGRTYK